MFGDSVRSMLMSSAMQSVLLGRKLCRELRHNDKDSQVSWQNAQAQDFRKSAWHICLARLPSVSA